MKKDGRKRQINGFFFLKKYLPILIHFSLIEFLIQIQIIVGKS